MQVIDCLNGEVKAKNKTPSDVILIYEQLGGRKMGYCIAEDDEPVVKKDKPDEKGWLF